MSKSPRKGSKMASYSDRSMGGKKIGAYNFSSHIPNYKQQQHQQQRRFSIADSSTSSSDSEKTYKSKKYSAPSDSDSESSLTAVSENEDIKRHSKSRPSKRFHKSTKTYARKRTPKKTVDWKNHEAVVSSDARNSSDSDSEESEDNYSSSDDSDVDFVKLQAERKAKSMKAMKNVHKIKKSSANYSDPDLAVESGSEVDISDLVALSKGRKKSFNKKRRSSSMVQPKFGRRRSEAVLPEDINFKFEFGDSKPDDEEAIEDESSTERAPQEEEDIGEEVTDVSIPAKKGATTTTTTTTTDNANFSFEFDFDSPLIQVPKFKDDEINSDDDYEIDDNELLATLQADNGVDEFLGNDFSNSHTRNNSIGSYGDEEETDPFLKEEEKFLVNEFENNGFDEDRIDIEDFDLSESSNRNSLLDSFNNMNNDSNQVLQYESMESDMDEDVDDEEDEEDDFDEFIDFEVPLFEDDKTPKKVIEKKHKDKKHKRKRSNVGLNSDEDDDSYLWNYFFSSDNGSNSSEDEDVYRSADEVDKLNVEGLFKDVEKGRRHTLTGRKRLVANQFHDMNYEDNYDSGDSTDVDESLPASNKSKVGSKLAKEVLSSKTADYRPPVLGTWVAIDSKPFGIIDGLSTRSLQSNAKNMEPRSKARKAYNAPNNGTDDLALGLDELLNISELDDDDENDVQIWRDFNNQKKQVPLGAFRNKSVLQNSIIHPENVSSHYNHTTKSNSDFNQRRYSLSNHNPKRNSLSKPKKPQAPRRNSSVSLSSGRSNVLSKLKRRRASIVEAVSEGFRPTKSGLFSEHALADVEEVLGDDNDLMALIKGL